TSDFTISTTGSISDAAITDVQDLGDGTQYFVTVDTGSGIGTLVLNVVDDDSIAGADGLKLGGEGIDNGDFAGGSEATYQVAPPQVLDIQRAATLSQVHPGIVTFLIDFVEAVSGVDASDFTVSTTGSISDAAIMDVQDM